MDHGNTKAREQYCWVVERNVIMEEQLDENRNTRLRCMHADHCAKDGGCKNRLLAGEAGMAQGVKTN